MTYSITEPHPSAAPSTRIHTGRGGAGNVYRTPSLPSSTSTSRTASLAHVPTHSTTSSSNPSSKFSSGRGGAGNIKPLSQAALYDLDEELKLQTSRDDKMSSWHVGRGGAGNFAYKNEGSERKMSNESATSSNGGSIKSGFFGRLRV